MELVSSPPAERPAPGALHRAGGAMVEASATLAGRCGRVDRALGAVEQMPGSVQHDLKRPLRVSSADFAGHHENPLWVESWSDRSAQGGSNSPARVLHSENPVTCSLEQLVTSPWSVSGDPAAAIPPVPECCGSPDPEAKRPGNTRLSARASTTRPCSGAPPAS
jgi:hypothetical protein